MFKFIDLFAGMGGFRIGLEQALTEKGLKGECVLTSEIKPYATKVYMENFKETNLKGNITKIEGKDIPDFDMLLAGFPCFIEGTSIYTEKGYIPIEQIKIGDSVLTHTNTFKEVLEVMESYTEEVYTIKVGNKFEIFATANHPFYTRTKELKETKWVMTKDLNTEMFLGVPSEIIRKRGTDILKGAGAFLFSKNTYWMSINKISRRKKKCKVYNLSVEEDNSYTANNFIVHNCQSFSSAGKRLGFEDTRGTLFFEVARILKEKQPKYFLLENVDNLVIHNLSKEDKKQGKSIGNTFTTILNVLESLGYKVTWKILQSSDYGVPQNRMRVYIVGSKDDYIDLEDFQKEYKAFKDVKETIPCIQSDFNIKLLEYLKENNLGLDYMYKKNIRDKRNGPLSLHSWNIGLRGKVTEEQKQLLEDFVIERRKKSYALNKGLEYKESLGLSFEDIKGFYRGSDLKKDLKKLVDLKYLRTKKFDNLDIILYDINGGRLSFEFTKFIDPNSAAPTLVATDVNRLGVVEKDGIRKLTIRECLRLNGYPDSYKLDIPYNQSMDLLGNTVTVPIIKMICDKILEKE